MPEPPSQEFDLPRQGPSGAYGQGIVLEAATLAWNERDATRRRAFDDIVTIKMDADPGGDNPFAQCDVFFSDGGRLRVIIENDARHGDDAVRFRAFVTAFFAQLGPEQRARIAFLWGANPAKRLLQTVVGATGTVACLGAAVFVLFSSDLGQDNNWLLIPLVLLMGTMCAGVTYASFKNRQTAFDPLAVPEAVLPMLPKKSGG